LFSNVLIHGGNSINNHYSDNWQELVEKVKSKGMRPGVSLKPGTPIEEVYPLVCFYWVYIGPVFLVDKLGWVKG